MPVVRIPTPLRRLTAGEAEVSVDGATLAEVVAALDARHPGLGERILDEEGRLRRFVNVFVRDEDVRFLDGLDTEVADEDVVSIIPAVAGGCSDGAHRSGATIAGPRAGPRHYHRQPARNGMTAA